MFTLTHEEEVALQTAIIRVSAEEIITSINDIGAALFGYTIAELVGKRLSVLIPLPDRARQSKAFQKAIGDPNREIQSKVVTAQRKDGTKFPVRHIVGRVERDAETGAPPYFISLISRMIAEE